MKFDRNTVIGFVLLALLFFGFFYFNNQEQARVAKERAIQDSIAKAALPKPKVDTSSAKRSDTSHLSTPQITIVTGQFQKAMIGSEQLAYVENDLVKIAFTNKGGQIKSVELKNFKDQEDKLVKL